jgi:hypothetical protein
MWGDLCAVSRYPAAGGLLVSAFLAVCFELLDVIFRVSQYTAAFMVSPRCRKSTRRGPACRQRRLPWLSSLTLMFQILLLMENGCGAIALIAALSQVYGETPTFPLLSLCSPEIRHVAPHSAREMIALRKRIIERTSHLEGLGINTAVLNTHCTGCDTVTACTDLWTVRRTLGATSG